MRITPLRCAFLATVALVAACSDQVPTAPSSAALLSKSNTPVASFSATWRDVVTGTDERGALWAMYVPNNWTGDVVFYVHGFVAPALPIGLPTDDVAGIRDALGPLGVAVAYSSFSQNGYDFKDGMQTTHQLRGLFKDRFGKPRRSFLIGHSLGGQIVQALAETHPDQYDGALALCGVLGGTNLQVDYIGQIRTVFDFFYPGVLPGTTDIMPPITDLNAQIIFPAYGAISADPSGFGAIASIDQTLLAGRNAPEMVNTLLNVLGYHALGANDLLTRTHGHVLFENLKTTYTSAVLPPAVLTALNGGVKRYKASERAEEWMEANYQPSGDLRIPMLTVHKRFDRLVPYRHEAAYQQIVARAGRAKWLRQRTVEDYGHCEFDLGTTMSNFQDLVQWVTTGTPPAP
jgi:pimeloyl-ACP methyl ester carboxylesterase